MLTNKFEATILATKDTSFTDSSKTKVERYIVLTLVDGKTVEFNCVREVFDRVNSALLDTKKPFDVVMDTKTEQGSYNSKAFWNVMLIDYIKS